LLQLNRGMDPLRTTGFERRLRILAYLAEDRQVSRAERRNASAINLPLLPLQFGHSEEFMRLAAPHAANGAVLVGLVALLATAGCSAANVGARHTGSFVQGRPVISLGTCCVGYQTTPNFAAIYATDKSRKSLWLPVVDKQGLPHPAGHRHDAYYTGDTVRAFHSKRPDGYAYKPIKATDDGRFDVDISRSLPDLRTVNFREFNAFDDGRLTEEGRGEVAAWVRGKYGKQASIKRLGEGGFSVAYRVCPKPHKCVVVKIRKMQPTFAKWKRVKMAVSAATELKRDLAIAEVAAAVTSWTTYTDEKGGVKPLLVGGTALPPLKAFAVDSAAASPVGRLARVAGVRNSALVSEGSVEQALIAFWASPELKKMVAEATAMGSTWQVAAKQEAAANADVREVEAQTFFEMYNKTSRFGPEVIKAHGFFQRCHKLRKLPTIAKYCLAVRKEFSIPDDFDERVKSLEWMYRDSAADVIRFTRVNFGRALGNPAEDGEFREIGLDYNHGRNAGWDPETRQFVLFDF
jgi:hypothetical protein